MSTSKVDSKSDLFQYKRLHCSDREYPVSNSELLNPTNTKDNIASNQGGDIFLRQFVCEKLSPLSGWCQEQSSKSKYSPIGKMVSIFPWGQWVGCGQGVESGTIILIMLVSKFNYFLIFHGK